MIRNYLAIAFRNIRNQPVQATINILSLSIGIAACIAVYLFIADESSFDQFHSKLDRIYRVNATENFTGTDLRKVATTGAPTGPGLAEAFPEIEGYVRFWGGTRRRVLTIGEKQVMVENVSTVDSTFFSVFDFEMLHGDPSTALDEPNSMVFTEKTARKFFENPADAVGSMVSKRGRDYKVTGVVRDNPENSHLQYDVLESIMTFVSEDSTFNTAWRGSYLNTYILLKPNADPKALESKFPDWLVRWTGTADIGKSYGLYLQPIREVHLDSEDIEFDDHNYRKFSRTYIELFSIIGILVLVVAAVNFMNLTVARATYRWKEIGVRTSLGARKQQLIIQLLSESVMLALIALIVALLIDMLFLPGLSQLIGRQLSLLALLDHPIKVMQILGLTVLLGLLTGIYPALHLTSVNPVQVLKGVVGARGKSILRSSLVVVQFSLAIAMIVSTWIVMQQLFFMKAGAGGPDKEQILLVELDSRNIKMMHIPPNAAFNSMKDEIRGLTSVLGVTASGQRLGGNLNNWGFKVRTDSGLKRFAPSYLNVDPDYFTVYRLPFSEGRPFSPDIPGDNARTYVVNEALVKFLDVKDPIGRQAGPGWMDDDSLGTIIGVVKDFHFNSLHHKINALSIISDRDWDFEEMSVKIAGGRVSETVEKVKRVYEKHTNFPFSYTFLDQHFNNLYRSDQQMSSVVSIMATLAILISCMGLFGLVVITTERMIKEIGIRKVLGATEIQITSLLLGTFTRLIVIAFVLAAPLAYYFLEQWLQTFAYRIPLKVHYFALSGLAALLVAVVTISHHTLRSARANPVKALKYE